MLEYFLGPQAERGCQQTGPVNWRKRRNWGLTPRAEDPSTHLPKHERLRRENQRKPNFCGMFGIRVRPRRTAMLSTKRGSKFEAKVVAPRHGFEPRFTAPKAAVLPLDDRGKSALLEEVPLQCSVALRAAATICYHRSWKLILAGAGRGLQTRRAVLMCRRWVRLPLASAKFQPIGVALKGRDNSVHGCICRIGLNCCIVSLFHRAVDTV